MSPSISSSSSSNYKLAFLESCLSASVLTFDGPYVLKSGRQSPYFFNAGLFHRADLLRSISTAYAYTILDFFSSSSCLNQSSSSSTTTIDILFGPAYKGIPLATATVARLAEIDGDRFGHLSYSFNRKEAKDHGEKGVIAGASLKGKNVVVIDDVITAGTAIGEACEIIRREGGKLLGIVVAVDRMERISTAAAAAATDGEGEDGGNNNNNKSAIEEVRERYKVPVLSIINLDDLIAVLGQKGKKEDMKLLEEYRRKWVIDG